MTGEALFVFILVAIVAVLMASNRLRFDIIALLVVLALMISGVLSVGESLSGFGSSVVILVAGLLVVGEMLDRTGVARAVGDIILKRGGSSEPRLLILIMCAAAILSAVMSSTAVVAVFIPIVLRISSKTRLSRQRLLIPMSYAALISGMLTLIATPPNIVVTEQLNDSGIEGFGFFSFTPIGLAVLVVAIAYILIVRRRLLPGEEETESAESRRPTMAQLGEGFQLEGEFDTLRIKAGSPLIGQTVAESQFSNRFGLRILGIARSQWGPDHRIAAPAPETEFHVGDTLLVLGPQDRMVELVNEHGLTWAPLTSRERQIWQWEAGVASVLIHPESRLVGKTIREVEFRSEYDLHVLGIRRAGEPVEDFEEAKLHVSDSLFVAGAWPNIDRLHERTHDFILTQLPRERGDVVKEYRKLPIAIAILVIMVLLTVFNVLPLVAAVLLAALAAVATRCLTMEDAYRSIHWSSIVLVAGMLPLADALVVTGGVDLVVDSLMAAIGNAGPYVVLTVVFFLTAIISLFLSNTAAAVLTIPIAISTAMALDVSPYPFAVAVIIGASAAYSTPVSTPVVTLVVEPGRYRFMDFVKVGVPLLVITWLITLFLTPIVFPFDGFDWSGVREALLESAAQDG